MDQPAPIPPTPVDVLSRAEIHALPKDQLRMYACTTTATVSIDLFLKKFPILV